MSRRLPTHGNRLCGRNQRGTRRTADSASGTRRVGLRRQFARQRECRIRGEVLRLVFQIPRARQGHAAEVGLATGQAQPQ